MDSIILWIQKEAPPVADMLGLKTSKQKEQSSVDAQADADATISARERREKGRLIHETGTIATPEQEATIKAGQNILATPEMIQFAIMHPERYVQLVTEVNAGRNIGATPMQLDIRNSLASGLEQAGAAASQTPIMLTPVNNQTIVNSGGGASAAVVLDTSGANMDQGVSAENR